MAVKQHFNQPSNWKLCGMNTHKLKLMCTKYEAIRWKHVEVLNIFVGVIFLGVTLFSDDLVRWQRIGTPALQRVTASPIRAHVL